MLFLSLSRVTLDYAPLFYIHRAWRKADETRAKEGGRKRKKEAKSQNVVTTTSACRYFLFRFKGRRVADSTPRDFIDLLPDTSSTLRRLTIISVACMISCIISFRFCVFTLCGRRTVLLLRENEGYIRKKKKKTERKAKKTEASYSGKVEQQIRKWNDANHVRTNRNAEGGQLIIYGNATWMRARE